MADVPVIATAVGGITEIIDHGKTGLLVEYGDEAGLGKAVTDMLEDSDLRDSLARQAKLKALSDYTESAYKEKITSLIQDALSRG